MDKKKKILTIAALTLIGGIVTLSITTGNIGNLRSAYIYDGDGNIIGSDDTANTTPDDLSSSIDFVESISINAPLDYANMPLSEQQEYADKYKAKIAVFDIALSDIDSRLDTLKACNEDISPDLDTYLSNVKTKTQNLATANTDLMNYKNDPANGTLVSKTRVSIADQEAELAKLLSQMPAGSPVTATSTAAVNNKRISTNKAIIAKTTTSAEQKSLLTTENTNITRINTLKTQLSALYKAKKYTTLLNTINSKQKELDIAIDTNEPRKELEVLNTNLTNYKKNKANGVVVDTRGTRVSIATLESDFATLVSQMPAGSPVTATSTAEVDNKRISDNNGLIGAWTTTGLTKKLQDAVKAKDKAKEAELRSQIAAINEENKKITSIATLKWRLQTAYSAKAYIALVKSIDAKTAEVTALGKYNSKKEMFEGQAEKRNSINDCRQEFVTWWNSYKEDRAKEKNTLSFSFSLLPVAYADYPQTPEQKKAEEEARAERARIEALRRAMEQELGKIPLTVLEDRGFNREACTENILGGLTANSYEECNSYCSEHAEGPGNQDSLCHEEYWRSDCLKSCQALWDAQP